MPVATIVIVTYNRKDELRRAVVSALAQSGDVEVLVLDDCSTDGTDEMMRTEFPQARYVRAEKNVGYIVHRNNASDLARSEILISIDDDAEFSSSRVVEQTLQDFNDPRIGAVAIPYIDVNIEPGVRQTGRDLNSIWLAEAFIGTAYAIRKEVFDAIGRFRAEFVHQGEESDFCLRMLDRDYVVRFGTADPILHHESAQRVRPRVMKFSSRNWVINILFNYPFPHLFAHLASKHVNAMRRGFKKRMYSPTPIGIIAGYWYALPRLWQRRPVRSKTLALFERLRRKGSVRLEDSGVALPQRKAPPDAPANAI